ncbi:ABC transporter ATP-binding protein [Desulfobotulus mexicanus]|uniref:ABC transporter ATP-binding protein n=1 Tax=Desulfobotulus mexicanus TaxID=2586642 RepID=A0A5Q4VDR6_9BACT|nr:ABC transporter ATP-binding protein [Desulfobotulus mexicanus]TYT75775.1 ABC transporter ATP-binding protein [Desulfobotulus mexicanus]
MKPYALLRPHIVENRHLLLAGFLCLLLVNGLQLWIPRVIKHVVDGLSSAQAGHGELMRYGLTVVVIALFIAVFRYGWRYCLIGTSRKIERDLRDRLYAHLLTLDAPFFDQNRTGDLMSRATSDIMNVRMATGMGIVAMTDAILLGGAAVGFMLWISGPLTLLALIPMPFIVLTTRLMSTRMHKNYTAVQEGLGEMTEMVREAFSGIRVVKVFGMGSLMDARLRRLSDDYLARRMSLARTTGLMMPAMVLFTNMALAIVVGAGGWMVIEERISTGDFVAFLSYLGLLTWPMMALGWMTNLIQRGRASLERLAAVMGEEPRVRDAADARPLLSSGGGLVLKNVCFGFRGEGPEVLSDISLNIPPGSRVGITGPPGSGKTALLQLMARLYDPDSGTILLDGRDVKTIRLEDLRRQVLFLPQEPWIFSGTLKDNIAGLGAVDEKKLGAACRAAQLDDTLASFPMGLETLVGERGVTLSGGQKQRVALARTLLNPSPLLLLDDPVSQVDTVTAGHMLKALDSLEGNTRILASHRFSAVSHADLIVVMENGRIRATGDHQRLMQSDDYYAKTWRIQAMEAALREDAHGDF